jgi:hypothetical protein
MPDNIKVYQVAPSPPLRSECLKISGQMVDGAPLKGHDQIFDGKRNDKIISDTIYIICEIGKFSEKYVHYNSV